MAMVSMYNLGEVGAFLGRLARAKGEDGPAQSFVAGSIDFLRGVGSRESVELATRLQEPTLTPRKAVRALMGEERFVAQVAPVAVNSLLRTHGETRLAGLIAERTYPRLEIEDLKKALGGHDDAMRIAILHAAERQGEVWQAIHARGEPVPIADGYLGHSDGDADTTNIFLAQQGYFAKGVQAPLFATILTYQDPVRALLYTAGRHKGGLPIRRFPEPFRTVAFPLRDAEALTPRFEFHLFTPTAERLAVSLTPDFFAALPRGAFLLTDPKGIDENGRDVDGWIETVLKGIPHADQIDVAFLAGYTGAGSVYEGLLPKLVDDQRIGFHLGLGSTTLEAGKTVAEILSATPRGDITTSSIVGCPIAYARGSHLERPVHVYVYSNPDLRHAQTLWGIYKNVYSGILGKRLVEYAFKKLEPVDGDLTDDRLDSLVEEAETLYGRWITDAEGELERILVDVEGVRRERLEILPPSKMDAHESWRVKDMRLLFTLVRALFFEPFEGDGVDAVKLNRAKGRWQAEIRNVFSTRNPAAGASIEAGMRARSYQLIANPDELLPLKPDRSGPITFEGLNIAFRLRRRLGPGQMGRLPERMRGFIADARHVWLPQPLPMETRQGLRRLASLLAKWANGETPTDEEIQAFTLKPVTDDELQDTDRWRTLSFDDLLQTIRATQGHLRNSLDQIGRGGKQHAKLSRLATIQIEAMVAALTDLEAATTASNTTRPLSIPQLGEMMHALKALIVEGDRIYIEPNLASVMIDLKGRLDLMTAFLEGTADHPYPTGIRSLRRTRKT